MDVSPASSYVLACSARALGVCLLVVLLVFRSVLTFVQYFVSYVSVVHVCFFTSRVSAERATLIDTDRWTNEHEHRN